jgi:hypothetical protein
MTSRCLKIKYNLCKKGSKRVLKSKLMRGGNMRILRHQHI